MKKRVVLWTLLLAILGAFCPARRSKSYANLKELREEQGDTVTTLQVGGA